MLDTRIILETALNRDEITPIEVLVLLEENGGVLPELFEVADVLNQRVNNNVVTYVRSKKVHYTNVCRAECKFCSFFRKKNDPSAVTLRPQDVVDRLSPLDGARQVEIQGGLNPDLTLDYHLAMVRAIREAFPNAHIHGYSPAEIWYTARRVRSTPYDVLRRLRDAGLGSLSGDSAVILNDKVRKKVAFNLLRTYEWIEIIKTAHRLGLSTTATVLFGHIEDEIQTGEHLEIIKSLHKRTGGISAVEPVPFIPAGTVLSRNGQATAMPTADHILRLAAVCRLFFGRTIKNIQVEWPKVGLDTAIRSLAAGVNDIGTLNFDKHEIRAPEVNGRLTLDAMKLKAAIRKAGRIPMERQPYTMAAPQPAAPSRPVWQRAEELAVI